MTAATSGDVNNVAESPVFFPVSVPKLITLSIATFGIYNLIWFYQNWVLERERRRFEEISPFWRMFFSVFYCYPMFKLVREAAHARGIRAAYSPGALATAYILLVVFAVRLPDPWWIICLGSGLPFVPVQQAANAVNAVDRPSADRNARFTALNWVVVALGVVWIALVVLGMALPE